MIRPIIGANFSNCAKQVSPSTTLSKQQSFTGSGEEDPEAYSAYMKAMTRAFATVDSAALYNLLNVDRRAEKFEQPPMMLPEERTKDSIQSAIRKGIIDDSEINSICDFGCGCGQTTTAIRQIFNPDYIIGVDCNDRYKVHDRSVFKHCDGVEYLNSGERQFDLITACMMDPRLDAGTLLEAAPKSMSENGKFLVFSDNWTMSKLEEYLKSQDIRHETFRTDVYNFKTIVIDKDELLKAR